MGLDQRALQLLLNVVMITGVTSLALMCYLRRRDRGQVRAASVPRQEPASSLAAALETGQVPSDSDGKAESAPIFDGGDQDIRLYVARRSREWSASASK
jgi:hypothetical protein